MPVLRVRFRHQLLVVYWLEITDWDISQILVHAGVCFKCRGDGAKVSDAFGHFDSSNISIWSKKLTCLCKTVPIPKNQVPYAIGEMLLALTAFVLQEWKSLQIGTAIASFALLIVCYFMPESPRWLLETNRMKSAQKTLEKGAKMNRKKMSVDFEISAGAEPEKQLGFLSLFSTKFVTKVTTVMSINWIVTNICYYGLTLNSVNLVGSGIYGDFALSAAIEIPSYVFAALTIDRVGRKPLLIFCQILAGISCILAGVIDNASAVLVLSLAGIWSTEESNWKSSNTISLQESLEQALAFQSFTCIRPNCTLLKYEAQPSVSPLPWPE